MEVIFNNSKLQKLYETGTSKKYRLEERILDEFIMAVEVLEAAKNIHDLWKRPGYKFEKLRGHKNLYSMRLGRKYRLEITIDWADDSCTVGIVGLEDISIHYGGK